MNAHNFIISSIYRYAQVRKSTKKYCKGLLRYLFNKRFDFVTISTLLLPSR